MKPVNKLMDVVSWIAITSAFGLIVLYAVVSFYPFTIIKFNLPYKVLTPTVKQGQNLEYQRSSYKYIDLPATMNCWYQDDLQYYIPATDSNSKIGSHDELVIQTVPDQLPPGKYKYDCNVTYVLYGIRVLRYEFYTDFFTVVK